MFFWVVSARMRAGLDGILLGGQAEGIPAHGMQDIEAAHALVAREDIGGGVALGMADVQAGAGRIGEHVEDVVFRLVGDIGRAEGLVFFPVALPARFDDLGVIGRHEREPLRIIAGFRLAFGKSRRARKR